MQLHPLSSNKLYLRKQEEGAKAAKNGHGAAAATPQRSGRHLNLHPGLPQKVIDFTIRCLKNHNAKIKF